jgi:hypothetical protein
VPGTVGRAALSTGLPGLAPGYDDWAEVGHGGERK